MTGIIMAVLGAIFFAVAVFGNDIGSLGYFANLIMAQVWAAASVLYRSRK